MTNDPNARFSDLGTVRKLAAGLAGKAGSTAAKAPAKKFVLAGAFGGQASAVPASTAGPATSAVPSSGAPPPAAAPAAPGPMFGRAPVAPAPLAGAAFAESMGSTPTAEAMPAPTLATPAGEPVPRPLPGAGATTPVVPRPLPIPSLAGAPRFGTQSWHSVLDRCSTVANAESAFFLDSAGLVIALRGPGLSLEDAEAVGGRLVFALEQTARMAPSEPRQVVAFAIGARWLTGLRIATVPDVTLVLATRAPVDIGAQALLVRELVPLQGA